MTGKKLYRSKEDRILFGVCGGLGEYFDVDSVVIRLIFVILGIWGGLGIILYIVGIFLIPEESTDNSKSEGDEKKSDDKVREKVEAVASEIKEKVKSNSSTLRGDQVVGLIILLIGLLILFQNFFSWMGIWKLWPLVLIIVGIAIVAGSSKGRK